MADVNKTADRIKAFFADRQPETHPIENHPVKDVEEFAKNLYFDMLCVVAQYENEDMDNQIKFIRRIMSGAEESMEISEHIRRALSFTVENAAEFVKQCKDNGLCEIFFVDALVISCANGEPNRKQVEFLAQIADIFCFSHEKTKWLSGIACSILEQNSDRYFSVSKNFKAEDAAEILEKILCYSRPFVNGYIIDTDTCRYFYSMEKSSSELIEYKYWNLNKVIIENQIIINKMFNFADVETVIIRNCVFKNFSNDYIISLYNIQNVLIENCSFDDFQSVFYLGGYVDNFKVSGCKFKNGKGYYMYYREYGSKYVYPAIIATEKHHKIDFYDCGFTSCSVNSNIHTVISGYNNVTVNNCVFKNCNGSYMFKNGNYKNNNSRFENCCREHYSW